MYFKPGDNDVQSDAREHFANRKLTYTLEFTYRKQPT